MNGTHSKVILIQPGATEFDHQGRIQGTLDVPLSERGVEELVRRVTASDGEKLDIVYSSPCQAAVETAAKVSELLHVKTKTVECLQNVDYGLWQGLLVDDVKRKQPKVYKQWQDHPETICPPEGEMLSTARERVATSLFKFLKKHKNGTIGLVVPEPLASLIRSLLRQTELSDLWKANGDVGGWEVIDVEPEVLTTAN